MELQPSWFAILGIWLPAALLAVFTLAWGLLADRGRAERSASPLEPWMRRASMASAAVLVAGVSFLAVVAAVHAHAEREAEQQR